jgi:hypothetical protein
LSVPPVDLTELNNGRNAWGKAPPYALLNNIRKTPNIKLVAFVVMPGEIIGTNERRRAWVALQKKKTRTERA